MSSNNNDGDHEMWDQKVILNKNTNLSYHSMEFLYCLHYLLPSLWHITIEWNITDIRLFTLRSEYLEEKWVKSQAYDYYYRVLHISCELSLVSCDLEPEKTVNSGHDSCFYQTTIVNQLRENISFFKQHCLGQVWGGFW